MQFAAEQKQREAAQKEGKSLAASLDDQRRQVQQCPVLSCSTWAGNLIPTGWEGLMHSWQLRHSCLNVLALGFLLLDMTDLSATIAAAQMSLHDRQHDSLKETEF